MGAYFDIGKIPVNFTKSILYILALMPYHYIAMCLFKNNVPINNIPFLLCACFCLSLSLLISSYFVAFFAASIFGMIFPNFNYDISDLIQGGGLIVLIVISLAVLISYLFGLCFKGFMIVCYGLIALRTISDFLLSGKLKSLST